MSILSSDLSLAVDTLRAGQPVAIPTETVYGLAARADNDEAIARVFALKNRPLNHPLIVHIAPEWPLHQWAVNIPDYVTDLILHFWPGPLTLVLPANPETVSPVLTGGQPTVAIRSPRHPMALRVLRALNIPLVAPSANPYEKISPTTAAHVHQSFTHEDLLILDGGRCDVGIESTIIDATRPEGFSLLRAGHITIEQLTRFAPYLATDEQGIRAPGQCIRHYQPEKKLVYVLNTTDLATFDRNTYCLSFNTATVNNIAPNYRFNTNPAVAAYEFYYQLRLADLSSATLLAIDLPPDTPQWQAIRERIIKAGQPALL